MASSDEKCSVCHRPANEHFVDGTKPHDSVIELTHFHIMSPVGRLQPGADKLVLRLLRENYARASAKTSDTRDELRRVQRELVDEVESRYRAQLDDAQKTIDLLERQIETERKLLKEHQRGFRMDGQRLIATDARNRYLESENAELRALNIDLERRNAVLEAVLGQDVVTVDHSVHPPTEPAAADADATGAAADDTHEDAPHPAAEPAVATQCVQTGCAMPITESDGDLGHCGHPRHEKLYQLKLNDRKERTL